MVLMWASGFVFLTVPKRSRLFAVTISVLVILNVWFIWGVVNPWSQSRDRIICLHVEKGNALVLESKSGDMLFIDPGSNVSRNNALAVVTDFLHFRNSEPVADIGLTSCSYTRSGTVQLLHENGLIHTLFAPSDYIADSTCVSITHGWDDIHRFHNFRIRTFKKTDQALDGIMVESPSGLRFLVLGEWGWISDTRLAGEISHGSTDIVYSGPARNHGPSHLLLRKARPKIIIAGGTGSLEQGAHDRTAGMGIKLMETMDGAVIIEDSGSYATIRQIKRS